MYCIVFSGRLLEGYDAQQVRQAVASRLGLDARQVERLFGGERMVLKKGITEASGRVYLDVLRHLGLDAGMARIPRSTEKIQTLASFKVVFWGRTLAGFEREAVMQAARRRLKAEPTHVQKMFSGAKAVLKRGVSAEAGSRYVVELARIGMQIDLEVETAPAAAPAIVVREKALPKPPATPSVAVKPTGFRRHNDDSFAGLLQTQFELPGTTDSADEFSPPQPERSGSLSEQAYAGHASALQSQARGGREPILAPQAKTSPDYIRCEQCGHRQSGSARCRVCGSAMQAAPRLKPIPMDASAYASHTTVLGNMPKELMRNSVASPAVPDDLRIAMLSDSRNKLPEARQRTPLRLSSFLGVTVLATLLLWFIW